MSAIAPTLHETLNAKRCNPSRTRDLYLDWMRVQITRVSDDLYNLLAITPGAPDNRLRATRLDTCEVEKAVLQIHGKPLEVGQATAPVWARELRQSGLNANLLALALVRLATVRQRAYWVDVVRRMDAVYPLNHHHGLSREERSELGCAIRNLVNTDRGRQESSRFGDSSATRHVRRHIRDYLNEAGASSVLYNMPSCLDLVYCEDCGHFELGGQTREGQSGVDGVCGDCAGCTFLYCEDTARYVHADSVYVTEDGDFYEDEDNMPSRYDDDDGGLMDYSTDVCDVLEGPRFDSSETGPFTIGVELEVYARSQDSREDLIRHIADSHGSDVICKADGSLSDSVGVELVTRPMSVSEALALFQHMELPEGTTAWNAGSCGMHVHIDGRAFNEASLAKFMSFWNDMGNLELIRQVAGRHPAKDHQATSYAALDDMDFTDDVISRLKKSSAGVNRYRAVNLTNLRRETYERLGLDADKCSTGTSDTVEVRIFRASLRKERLLAQIEMAAAVVHFARDDKAKDQGEKEFRKWLKRNAESFPALAAYLAPKPKLKAKATEQAEEV